MARPSKYKPEFCERIIELRSEGASIVEVAAEFGASKMAIYRWRDEFPEFAEALAISDERCEAWWEKQGRTHLKDRSFNSTLWYMNMKNRFGWADKQEVDHTTQGEKLPQPILQPLRDKDEEMQPK